MMLFAWIASADISHISYLSREITWMFRKLNICCDLGLRLPGILCFLPLQVLLQPLSFFFFSSFFFLLLAIINNIEIIKVK
jgi:hypothetical protein